MDKSKVIYDNGSSKCVVGFDGELIKIVQLLDGDIISDTLLYIDEFDEIVNFVNTYKPN